jgi:hypothetical protein
MNEPMDKKQQFFLVAEMGLSFLLGVFGNKVAEFLDISTITVFFGVFVVFFALALVNITSKQYKKGKSSPRTRITPISKKLTSMFSISTLLGLITGLICILINPASQVIIFTRILLAEIYCCIISLVTIFFVSMLTKDRVLVIVCSLGLGAGISMAIILLAAIPSNIILTIAGWAFTELIIGITMNSQTSKKFMVDLQNIINSIVNTK